MNGKEQKQIQESRAAALLGMSEEELRRLSQMAGLGQEIGRASCRERV